MRVTLQGPLAGAVVAIIGLYLLFAPIERLARKQNALTWMKVFFRGLGAVLLVLAGLLLAPLIRGG